MAITDGVGPSYTTTSSATPSVSLVGCTSGRTVIAHVTCYDSPTRTIDSATCGGVAMTALTQQSGATHKQRWFYLTLGSSGDKTVQATLSGSASVSVWAMELVDVDSGDPISSDTQTTGTTGGSDFIFAMSFTTADANAAAFVGMSAVSPDINSDAAFDVNSPFTHLLTGASSWHTSTANRSAGLKSLDVGAAGTINVAGQCTQANATVYCNVIALKPLAATGGVGGTLAGGKLAGGGILLNGLKG